VKSVTLASARDPLAPGTFSGTPLHLSYALERNGIEVVPGGPLFAKEPPYYQLLRSLNWRLGRGWLMGDVEPQILAQRSRALAEILSRSPSELVISIEPYPIAAMPPSVPAVLVHDCTFASVIGYYGDFSRLSRHSIEMCHRAYRQALDHASFAVFSSEWAANSAVNDYGMDINRVHVIEFGANLAETPATPEVDGMVESRLRARPFRFLFVGVDWERKGGDDALKFIRLLRKMGVQATLDIVGCEMRGGSESREFCTEHGFLDKRISRDRQALVELYKAASFLLLPSIAECCACAFCEANAFGVPCISRDTGGVKQAIRPGINGFLLTEDGKNMAELAESVKAILDDEDAYRKISRTSRLEYEQRLNWDRFVERLLDVLRTTGSY
jgi:glycosyltransferase involved in cell wall biosynthesis